MHPLTNIERGVSVNTYIVTMSGSTTGRPGCACVLTCIGCVMSYELTTGSIFLLLFAYFYFYFIC